MSKTRRDLDYLRDIQEAIIRVLSYINDLDWEEYLRDRKTQDAVIRNLEILGEASKSLSAEIRGRYPSIPWQYISGTRNRLIHHYFGVNQEIVWQIIQQDLPKLKPQIEQVIEDLSSRKTE
jgi:uncharacterized protein with HEPN domain